MTANQLQYWSVQEQIRANKAKEIENERSNKAKEAENFRSNVAREKETHRHNRLSEMYQGFDTAANLNESTSRVFKNYSDGVGNAINVLGFFK